ncbi:hypothetical protein K505DRAFT_144592 [Melanomma pulvis-pyrius CBS 109.77]|uniref:Rhodopsin domain-containing protein n=1 Tax=Melanomma pulvis-pyrius CBS 109.77 TaxID=1314802 RepID=A0A6A6XLE7_9PLEO|nr:hypothetical protein K505DRAFT_144592 [Melanomma pulvis-pyrius CBS 109.77]
MGHTNAPTMVTSMWTITGVALLFILLRLFMKWRYGKKIGCDDGLITFSWGLLVVYTAFIHMATKHGLGYHIVDIPDDDLPIALKYLTIAEFFAVLALQISKTSFAVTLLRLAGRSWHNWLLWGIIITLNVVMGFDAIEIFASCTPVAKIWRPLLAGSCWDPRVIIDVSIFAGAYSGVMDLILAGFPIVLLWPLRIERKEKIGVSVAMSLGVFAGIAAFIKTSYLPDIGRWQDVTYSCYVLIIWAAAEVAITIVATSIPYLRLAFKDPRHRSRGYQMDDEVHMDNVIPDSKITYTASTTENMAAPIPAIARKEPSNRERNTEPVVHVQDSWNNYPAKMNSLD